jgi:hypothetical protein
MAFHPQVREALPAALIDTGVYQGQTLPDPPPQGGEDVIKHCKLLRWLSSTKFLGLSSSSPHQADAHLITFCY